MDNRWLGDGWYHHSQLKFSKYWLVLILIVAVNAAILAGVYYVVDLVTEQERASAYPLESMEDMAALGRVYPAYAGSTLKDKLEEGGTYLLLETAGGETHVVMLETFAMRSGQTRYRLVELEDGVIPWQSLKHEMTVEYTRELFGRTIVIRRVELRVLSHAQLSLVSEYRTSMPNLEIMQFAAILVVMTVVELVVWALIDKMFR